MKRILMLIAIGLFAITGPAVMVGCQDDEPDTIEDAVEETGDAVEDAADEVEDAADEATE